MSYYDGRCEVCGSPDTIECLLSCARCLDWVDRELRNFWNGFRWSRRVAAYDEYKAWKVSVASSAFRAFRGLA